MRFSLLSIKCSAAPSSLRLLPSTVWLSELRLNDLITARSAAVESWEEPANIWLTVAKNAFFGWALNFRVRMLLKGGAKRPLLKLRETLGQVQTPYFTWAESNANEWEQRILLICIRFGSCEVRRLNLALNSFLFYFEGTLGPVTCPYSTYQFEFVWLVAQRNLNKKFSETNLTRISPFSCQSSPCRDHDVCVDKYPLLQCRISLL